MEINEALAHQKQCGDSFIIYGIIDDISQGARESRSIVNNVLKIFDNFDSENLTLYKHTPSFKGYPISFNYQGECIDEILSDLLIQHGYAFASDNPNGYYESEWKNKNFQIIK